MSNFVVLPVIPNMNRAHETEQVMVNTDHIAYCKPAPKTDNRTILGIVSADNPFIIALSVGDVVKLIQEEK